ncbi:hypothetical protein Q4E93_15545 [Flavitalea sp. BT771]|uniref:hypothetical protein n=1 Tax=Flavitalea sp. BT771 TaxID=3063329 RepID=UPI0026E4768B|nr:hypothetical protein [Flavitalea sp. BT771]MDO6432015.1 hypothetical protein [Flavitalea sp. BT771]MDV6220924.1 hypothetical protein [Flavitalea sp. BT771]
MRTFMMLLLGICLYGGIAKGQDIRKVGKEKFRIVDTAGFYLYSINKLVQGEKIARPETVYYFSIDRQSPVMELTVANLEKAFAGNAKFRYSMEAEFRSDKQLMAYDKQLKVYKLKYLYSQSSK